jgi:hypothetical protein
LTKTVEQISKELNLKLDAKIKRKIIKTLQQIPQNIYNFVLENVQFEEAMDCCLPIPEIKKTFLVLVQKDASICKIAHEIAHAYLKHPAYTNISIEKAKEFEKQAIELAEKWLGCNSEDSYQPPNLSFR